MQYVTLVVLGALLAYMAGLILGNAPGGFSGWLFAATLVTLVYWLAEQFKWAPERRAAFERATKGGAPKEANERLLQQPWWIEFTAGFFPVIALVFVLRSFLFEPFRIPSGSMLPTLEIGDLILVNKFNYGIRLPVINKKVVPIGDPKRGDVVVFRFPHNPSQDYIKRVVGLPGDRVDYLNKELRINGQVVATTQLQRYLDESRLQSYQQFTEKLGEMQHRIIMSEGPGFAIRALQHTHPNACQYGQNGVSCTVPSGHYFVMGDNRDNSEDSRYWGFVPDENIVGRAFFVWLTLRGWVPSFDRVGRFD